MDFETAKLYCDMILAGTAPYILDKDNKYPEGAVIEFIGGEPLLQVDLISQICDYLITEMIKQNHPWLFRFRFSISSNGTLYFTPKVQKFIKKFAPWLSLNITMDGNKELSVDEFEYRYLIDEKDNGLGLFVTLSQVLMPKGVVKTSKGYEFTRYSSCYDQSHPKLYYRTYSDPTIREISIADPNLDKEKIVTYPLSYTFTSVKMN